jgi:hypothetical protein
VLTLVLFYYTPKRWSERECVLGMMLEPKKLETLRRQVCGALIMPGDAQYESSRDLEPSL